MRSVFKLGRVVRSKAIARAFSWQEMSEVTPVRKLMQLSTLEAWMLLQAVVLLPTVRLALHFMPVSRLKDFGASAVRGRRLSQPALQATARMVRVAARHGLSGAKCLEQSLVLCWLLRRQGIDAEILFGARKEADQMQAHAWVEVDGVSLDADNDAHRPFSRFEEVAASDGQLN